MNRLPNHLLVAPLIAVILWSLGAGGAFAEETIRGYKAYQIELSAEQRQAATVFARSTSGEPPLARLERLAHDYAYGGSGGDWTDKELLARMKADGFSIVETVRDPDDGFAAMLVKDERSGRHVLALRGTDDAGMSSFYSGKGDAWSDLGEVTAGVNVGITQFENDDHAAWLDGIARSYGRDGKLDVTGHSLGGALGNLFAASYPEIVNRVVTFQAPAVSEAVRDKFNENVGKLPVAERPLIEATVAADDPVSLAGTHYLPGTVVHAVTTSDRASAVLGNHTAFVWQTSDLKRADGEPYAPTDRLTTVKDFGGDMYAALRKACVIDGLVDPRTVDDRRQQAAAVVDGLVLQQALEDELERLHSTTDPAAITAAQQRINRLWETVEAKSKSLDGWHGLEATADQLERQAAATSSPDLKELLRAESARCRKAAQTLKQRDELVRRAVGGEPNLELPKQWEPLTRQAADEHRERRREFSERMQLELRDRKEQAEKFERRAVDFAKQDLKPRALDAPLDPNEAKPIIPEDCTLEIAVGDPTGGRAFVDTYHVLGGVVTATRPTRIAPEKNGPGFWDAEERYPYAFTGRVLGNELVGQWVTSSPEEGKRWNKTRLDQHSVGRTTHTEQVRIVLYADGTASWESETTTVRQLHALVGVFDADTNETEVFRTTTWPQQSGAAVWRIRPRAAPLSPSKDASP